jgi:glycosyltransferase involved in cell wall biosynthesis
MKILFASLNYHRPEGFTGVSVTMHTLALAMMRRGHDVALVVGSRSGSVERPPADLSLGYPVFRCGTASALARVLALEPFDALMWHCNEAPPMIKATRARTAHAVAYLQNAEFHLDYAEAVAWPGFRWVANSRFTAGRFADQFGVRPLVINQPVASADYRVSAQGTHVLFVNPDRRKGVELVLDLAERFPHIPFRFQESWLTDPGATRPLRDRAARAGNIDWHAPIADMRAAFASARLLLMPSVWPESWGRTASEAGVSGIPALATSVGGLPEAVGPGGVLIDPKAPIEYWAAALARLWGDGAYRDELATAARIYALRPEIDVERVTDRLLAELARSPTPLPSRARLGDGRNGSIG